MEYGNTKYLVSQGLSDMEKNEKHWAVYKIALINANEIVRKVLSYNTIRTEIHAYITFIIHLQHESVTKVKILVLKTHW